MLEAEMGSEIADPEDPRVIAILALLLGRLAPLLPAAAS